MDHITQPEFNKSSKSRQNILIIFVIVFIIIIALKSLSSNNSNTKTVIPLEQINTVTTSPSPTMNIITIEQKQSDFLKFYKTFVDQAQLLTTFQLSAASISKSTTDRDQLFTALDRVETMSSNTTRDNKKLKIPDSLSEYIGITNSLADLNTAGETITKAIKTFKGYAYNEDPEALSDGKDLITKGNLKLNDSYNKMDEVAKELNVDLSQIENTK